MNEICIESCNPKGDCSGFEVKPNLTLDDMPPFPETKDMSKEEKFTSVTIYLSKVIDHLQGIEDERYGSFFPKAERKVSTHESKAIMEVTATIQSLQNEPVDAEADKAKCQSTDTKSKSLFISESITRKENE